MILDVRGEQPDPEHLRHAAGVLRVGLPVVMPTDTVYGLAVDPFSGGATDRLFELKERPRSVPLPVLVAGVEQVEPLVSAITPAVRRLMDRCWPGALTIVLPRHPELEIDLGVRTGTIGVRCPDHPVPIALAAAVGPLATTSANRHGEPTPHDAAEAARALAGDVSVVLDGGRCDGAPSTVVEMTDGALRVLREGSVTRSDLERVMGSVG